tara:strand:- start:1520 stop:3178 length:1659 start_codon:yes stop_codon:yes gene_type:complete
MSNTITQLKIGTRASKLALKQTELVLEKLKKIPDIKNFFSFKVIKIKTEGDINKSKILQAGYKGFFTKKIDDLLIKKKIDLAVHSTKDIPSKLNSKIIISAFLKREDPRDILFSKKNYTFNKLPKNITIGTSSIRRKKQILNLRPDLNVSHMRGNVETRIKKFKKNKYYAIMLALAGIKRLGISYKKKNILNTSTFVPAGGQGAIAITIRKKSSVINNLIKKINNIKTEIEIKTERKFLEKINANCDSPVGAYAKIIKNSINFLVSVPNYGNGMFTYKLKGKTDKPEILGIEVANFLKKKFGKNFLKETNYKKTLLLTRPKNQLNEIKKYINPKNFKILSNPMLEIQSIKLNKNKIRCIRSADTIIFTSSNAVEFSKNYLKSFKNKVFCVGKDTKKTCLKNNIKNVFSANGNVLNLIKMIKEKIKNKKDRLVYISAKQTAVNLESILKLKKFNIKKIVIYESNKVQIINKSILKVIRSNQLNFISFFSKRTAHAFNNLILKYKLNKYLNSIECISLSKEIEKIVKENNFRKYYVCTNSDRESFLKFINQNLV